MSRRKVIPMKPALRSGTEPVVVSRAWLEQVMELLTASDICLRNALAQSARAKKLLREHMLSEPPAPVARARRRTASASES